jgi:hypothetical protein
LGRKDRVPNVPIVARVADVLRAHGPTWLGQIGFELVMPMSATLSRLPSPSPRSSGRERRFVLANSPLTSSRIFSSRLRPSITKDQLTLGPACLRGSYTARPLATLS